MASRKFSYQYVLAIVNVTLFVVFLIAYFAGPAMLLPELKTVPDIVDLNLDTGFRASTITVTVLMMLFLLNLFLFPSLKIKGMPSVITMLLVLFFMALIIDLFSRIYDLVSFKPMGIETALSEIFEKHTEETQHMFDELQSSLKCCGLQNNTDYGDPSKVPSSCQDNEYTNHQNTTVFYKIGCTESLSNWIAISKAITDGAVIAFQVSEIIGLLPAFVAYKHSTKPSTGQRWRSVTARFARGIGLRSNNSQISLVSTACVQQYGTQLALRARVCSYVTEQLYRHFFLIVIFCLTYYLIFWVAARSQLSSITGVSFKGKKQDS